MILLTAALAAPLTGVLARWPRRLHAVTMQDVVNGWERGTFRSACGFKGLKLVVGSSDGLATPWPPRLRGLPDGFIRCPRCWEETGKKRPRCEFKVRT